MHQSPAEKLSHQIHPFIPEEAVGVIVRWIIDHQITLNITRSRKSVLGDYRQPQSSKGHRISVNRDLNRYAFLITLVHEMAHLTTWLKFRDTVSAHGKEWKQEFKLLMNEFSGRKIFPGDVRDAVKGHLVNPHSTHCDDPELTRVLGKYDKIKPLYLEDLKEAALFELDKGRVFKKGEKLRKRIKCYELKTNRIYLFTPTAEVKEFKTDRY